MGFRCGLVGLPNVGKSTLFNALTRTASARAENFPFCTVEPNVGSVEVPDTRLETLTQLSNSARTIYARMTFVDIAGLIRGASKGEGLGNQFLAHIREMDAIAYVLRCFDDNDITHVHNRVDPVDDAQTLETELMLADLDSLQKRLLTVSKRARSGDKEMRALERILLACAAVLEQGITARAAVLSGELSADDIAGLNLLSALPVVYIANVGETDAASGNDYSRAVEVYARERDSKSVVICARLEEELASLSVADAAQWMQELGMEMSGVDTFIRCGYEVLDLITFLTTGAKESRAWTVERGTNAVNAAGVIHTDFVKHFIRAEVTAYADFVASGGATAARENGQTRLEGKDYLMQDGEVVYFRIGK